MSDKLLKRLNKQTVRPETLATVIEQYQALPPDDRHIASRMRILMETVDADPTLSRDRDLPLAISFRLEALANLFATGPVLGASLAVAGSKTAYIKPGILRAAASTPLIQIGNQFGFERDIFTANAQA